MLKSQLVRQVLRFGVVGVVVTGSFMALNWFLAGALGEDMAFLAAYFPAVGLHFGLNKWWTFDDRAGVRPRQVSEYAGLVAGAFLIQAGMFMALLHFTSVPGWLASGLATVAQMALSFLWMQRRIFAPPA